MAISVSGANAIGRAHSIIFDQNIYDFMAVMVLMKRYPYWNGIWWPKTRVAAVAG